MSGVEVVDSSPRWAEQYDEVARVLRAALADVPSASVEHVGSTSVPGLAAKPILDIDVIVEAGDVPTAITALEGVGYVHRGDLGVAGREAFHAPGPPRRNVYVCTAGTTNVRNHLAVREVLRTRDDQPRPRGTSYAATDASLRNGDQHGEISTSVPRVSG